MPSTLSRWYSSWPLELFCRRRTFARVDGPVGFLFLSSLESVTLASEMVFKTWSSKPVSPTPLSRARARTSWRAIHFPFASRSTSTHAVHAVSMRASLQRDVREGEIDAGDGSGGFLLPFFDGAGGEGSGGGGDGARALGAAAFASRLTAACGLCLRCASEGGGAGSATNSGSVAGTSPSAPRGRSGRVGVTRGFAEDITRVGAPARETDRSGFDAPSANRDAFAALDSNLSGSNSEDAALRFAAASRCESRRELFSFLPFVE
mmetsp:Transcript_11792/g.50539  ORF Transcript_11792/g.50539 Transcript_11792/m.50539 type:complete len:263 (+) Transcript_11792:2173-2961(+)